MTSICSEPTLREVFIDLQLFALTASLPKAPEACQELATIEGYLQKLRELGLEYPHTTPAG